MGAGPLGHEEEGGRDRGLDGVRRVGDDRDDRAERLLDPARRDLDLRQVEAEEVGRAPRPLEVVAPGHSHGDAGAAREGRDQGRVHAARERRDPLVGAEGDGPLDGVREGEVGHLGLDPEHGRAVPLEGPGETVAGDDAQAVAGAPVAEGEAELAAEPADPGVARPDEVGELRPGPGAGPRARPIRAVACPERRFHEHKN